MYRYKIVNDVQKEKNGWVAMPIIPTPKEF